MCGIIGICGKVGISSRELLDKIKHRGPDDSGYWKNDHFEFGFVRLSIIDLNPEANQPMADPETGNIIIYNGEIYNYIELREELKAIHNFKTKSDTEVILAAYKKWGSACLSKLRGMFALAIYDNSKQAVFAARDRLGIKPFYYRQLQGGLIFSSEIKSLVNIKIAGDEVHAVKATEFLCARQLDCDHETLFKDVYQLQPGTFVWIDATGALSLPTQFWELKKHGEKIFLPEKDGKEFVDIFKKCIHLHMRSDVPIGAFVSGGLDSSSVASFMLADDSISTLHTFSAILPVRNEENRLIDLITHQSRVIRHEFYLDGKGFFNEIGKVIYQHDEPIQDGSMYSHYKLCEIASQQGVKVLLSGSGGDELLGGYASHVYSYLGSILKQFNFSKYVDRLLKISKNSSYSIPELLKKSAQECLTFHSRLKYKHNYFRKISSHTDLTENVDLLPFYYHTDPDPWNANYVNNYRSWSVPPYLHYEDRNSMAFGVEARVPFYDHVLIEYISEFHPDSMINGRSKSIMRDSFKHIVPEKIINQKSKLGFPSPMDTLLRDQKETSSFFFEMVKDVPFFNQKKTEQLGIDFFNGKVDIGVFWRTLSLAIWYKEFFISR